MGTIYPTGYPIGENVQTVKLMEYGNYISNRISNRGKCTEYKVNGIWELYIQPEYGRKSERAQPLSQGVY